MPSKIQVTSLFALAFIAVLTGCTQGRVASGDEYVIGQKLTATSASNDQGQVVLFDKQARLIHEFDLNDVHVMRTFPVTSPEKTHNVLFEPSLGLIADFSPEHVTLFDRNNQRQVDPVEMNGQAISAATNVATGRLVTYDDQANVGLIQLDGNGTVVSKFAGGPLLHGGASTSDSTVTAGDLIDDGSLILALKSGEIAKVDFAATIASSPQHWVFTAAQTPVTDVILWVAPVHGFNDRVLIATKSSVMLVDIATGAKRSERVYANDESAAVYSKSADAHIVLQGNHGVVLVYTDGNNVLGRSLSTNFDMVFNSRLSLADDQWSFVESKSTLSYKYNDQEGETKDRVLRRYRLSDLHASKVMALPDRSQLDISQSYIFALYPSPMGKAERLGIYDGSTHAIEGFNVGYYH